MSETTIITGASRGIGRAIAIKMAEKGPVALVARDLKKLEAVCEIIQARGGKAIPIAGDVGDPETAKLVKNTIDSISSDKLIVKNLILNAGISKAGATPSFPDSAMMEMFKVNFFGSFYFVKEFLPEMLNVAAGNICLLAGTAGVKGYRSMAGYCASKHALIGFARALAMEVNAKGVNVVPVCPGPVDTDMTAALVKSLVSRGMTVDAAKSKIGEDNVQKRLLTPEEIAEKIFEICSLKSISSEPVLF